ncbi:MAG TPA: UDP-N-acetylglucosamine--N-acetylmuramyl-(pentapeptide) pyrophosphoryl-undecaprenol N-acetylglucosamine transferase, partial [Herpetosiphonaceae bacterium]|nr:UDP-N-acetylglucosamine--N-acetylmuramyl-(pentapeptide) pyrophosphoryl-undecaprenol N-acetylglucosamine transferase [Herpetosiphonaceae bacterium]
PDLAGEQQVEGPAAQGALKVRQPRAEGEEPEHLGALPHGRGSEGGTLHLVYVGSIGGMEQAIVERESTLPFRAIRAAAVRGRGPIQLARSAGAIAAGIRQAHKLLREERPAAILGTGGYVCVPLFLAARALRVPTMIYLPDIVPGLAVRSLAPIAARVACSFEPSLQWLPRSKTIVTGYPVRPEIAQLDRRQSRRELGLSGMWPVLLVYGGSRGARSINRAIQQLLAPLLEVCEILHVCGREGDEAFLRAAAEALPEDLRRRYHLHPYLQGTMPQALVAADLAICRAGASTLAELPAAGLPAVLIPLSHVHQDENAAYLTERGAAVTVADGEMLGSGSPVDGHLFRVVKRLLTDREELTAMGARSRALARLDAADRLADALLELAGWGTVNRQDAKKR